MGYVGDWELIKIKGWFSDVGDRLKTSELVILILSFFVKSNQVLSIHSFICLY